MGSHDGINSNKLELPKIDLSCIDMFRINTEEWTEAQEAVAQALQSHGAFEVIYDKIKAELRNSLLGLAIPELFAMQKVVKLPDNATLPYHGWAFQKPGYPFLALQITKPNSLAYVQQYVNNVWPQGNDFFSNTVWKYANHMQELMKIIHEMILESLGLEDHYDSHINSLAYSIRLTEYNKDTSYEGVNIVKPPHKDPNYISIVCQHKVDGLEVETLDGEWIHTTPLPNSFTVLLGEAFMAWTNGRLKAPNHRVKMDGFGDRYSAVFSTIPAYANDIIKVPEKLLDKNHSLNFKPFNYYDYVKFRFSDEGWKVNDALKVYCGI